MLSRVYIPGVWDLLHTGHVQVLQKAKCLGHVLVVGVPSDEVVEEDKGLPPINNLEQRVFMLSTIKVVDMVVAYYELEFCTHLEMIKPHVLAVGGTWGSQKRHKDAEAWCESNLAELVKLPYHPGQSTSLIKQKVYEQRMRLENESSSSKC